MRVQYRGCRRWGSEGTECFHAINLFCLVFLPPNRHRTPQRALSRYSLATRFGVCSNDLWKFTPETFSWKEVKPKGNGPSVRFECCCCTVGHRVIIFGGKLLGGNRSDDLFILDLNPSLKTLCKLVVLQSDLDQSELPHNLRWELGTMSKE